MFAQIGEGYTYYLACHYDFAIWSVTFVLVLILDAVYGLYGAILWTVGVTYWRRRFTESTEAGDITQTPTVIVPDPNQTTHIVGLVSIPISNSADIEMQDTVGFADARVTPINNHLRERKMSNNNDKVCDINVYLITIYLIGF